MAGALHAGIALTKDFVSHAGSACRQLFTARPPRKPKPAKICADRNCSTGADRFIDSLRLQALCPARRIDSIHRGNFLRAFFRVHRNTASAAFAHRHGAGHHDVLPIVSYNAEVDDFPLMMPVTGTKQIGVDGGSIACIDGNLCALAGNQGEAASHCARACFRSVQMSRSFGAFDPRYMGVECWNESSLA